VKIDGWRIGKVFGIELRLHWSVFLLAGLIAWSLATRIPAVVPGIPVIYRWLSGVIAGLGLIFSIVWHELAHSRMAIHYGLRPRKITLFLFGGAAEFEKEEFKSPKEEFFISVVGPISSLVFAGICYGLALILEAINFPTGLVYFKLATILSLSWLTVINFVLAVFNLFPVFPMDGGRVLRAVIWKFNHDIVKATKISVKLAKIFGVILVLIGYLIGGIGNLLWIGLIVWFFIIPAAEQEYLATRIKYDPDFREKVREMIKERYQKELEELEKLIKDN